MVDTENNMIDLARQTLAQGDCTLVVANASCGVRKFYRRGVADLLDLLQDEPDTLAGSSVADKIIGKAAAAIMIEGEVGEVYSRVITGDAIAIFNAAFIPVAYDAVTDMVENRTKTGRCPLDTICSTLSDTRQMVDQIKKFIIKQKSI